MGVTLDGQSSSYSNGATTIGTSHTVDYPTTAIACLWTHQNTGAPADWSSVTFNSESLTKIASWAAGNPYESQAWLYASFTITPVSGSKSWSAVYPSSQVLGGWMITIKGVNLSNPWHTSPTNWSSAAGTDTSTITNLKQGGAIGKNGNGWYYNAGFTSYTTGDIADISTFISADNQTRAGVGAAWNKNAGTYSSVSYVTGGGYAGGQVWALNPAPAGNQAIWMWEPKAAATKKFMDSLKGSKR